MEFLPNDAKNILPTARFKWSICYLAIYIKYVREAFDSVLR